MPNHDEAAAGYRDEAERCLTEAQLETGLIKRDRLLSMALTWLSLARQAEALQAEVKTNGDARGWERLTEANKWGNQAR